MKPVKIKCPACSGQKEYKALNKPCDYCEAQGQVLLAKHLHVLGKKFELHNVMAYQRHGHKKPTQTT